MPVHSVISRTYDLNRPLIMETLDQVFAMADSVGNQFNIAIYNGDTPVDLSTGSVNGYFIRIPAGKKIDEGSTIIINGFSNANVASVNLPEACYVEPCRFVLTIKVTLDITRHAVYVCEGAISRTTTDKLIDPGHTIPSLEELLSMISKMESAAAQVDHAVGSANSAASAANSAASNANNKASALENMTIIAHKVDAGGSPTASVSTISGHYQIDLGLVEGQKGTKGDKGETGDRGPEGPQGIQGDPGPRGEQGSKGDQGPEGPRGPKGDQGEPNIIKGQAYDSLESLQSGVLDPKEGDQYNVGQEPPYNIYRWTGSEWEDQGVTQGPKGDPGIPGAEGPAGKNGATFTPTVSPEGMLSWSNDQELPNPESVNIRGPKGEDGIPGINGENGEPGAPGKDGVTPHIDEESGNWFIGEEDTHVHAQGPEGKPGTTAGVPYSDEEPKPLGAATSGVSEEVSRADHVHPIPDVGGRNYLPNTKTMDGYRRNQHISILKENDGDSYMASWETMESLEWRLLFTPSIKYSLVRNKYITLSASIKSDDDVSEKIYFSIMPYKKGETTRHQYADLISHPFPKPTKKWTRFSVTIFIEDNMFTWSETSDKIDLDDTCDFAAAIFSHGANSFQIKEIKLEIGKVPTDWSPAPEDLVPATRTINGKNLGDDISLTPSDIGAVGSVWGVKADGSGNAKPQVGGRNLFQCSKTLEGWTVGNDSGSISDGVATIIENKELQDSNKEHYFRVGDYRKQKMVASFDVQSDNLDLLSPSLVISFFHENSRNARFAWKTISSAKIQKTGEWTRIHVFFRISDFESQLGYAGEETPLEDSDVFVVAYRTITGDQPFSGNFRLPKLEIGDVPTAWTPALEDVLPTISDVDLEAGVSNLETGKIYLVYE